MAVDNGQHAKKDKNTSIKGDVDSHSIFVRNLPYHLSDPQLQEIFGEIGPVRRSFLVKEKGSERNRGFGFVQFAVVEDAIRAVEGKNGADLHGRRIKVELAKRRAPLDERLSRKKQGEPDTPRTKGPDEGLQQTTGLFENSKKRKIVDRGLQDEDTSVKVQNKKKKKHKHDKLPCIKPSSVKDGNIDKKEEKPKTAVLQLLGGEAGVEVEKKTKGLHENGLHALEEHKTDEKQARFFEKGKTSESQRVARTVIFGGLETPEMREKVIECAKKAGPVEFVQSSLSPQELKGRGLEKDGCRPGAAAVVFISVKAASDAVASLHQKSIAGGTVWARQLGGEGSKPKKWKIIVRNLPFKVTEDEVRELLSSAGFIWELTIPHNANGQSKGFAFASFTKKADVEKAISTVNGKTIRKRPVAVDWAVERNLYKANTHTPELGSASGGVLDLLPSDMEDEETASEEEDTDGAEFDDYESNEGVSNVDVDEQEELQEADMTKKVLNKLVTSLREKDHADIDLKQSADHEFQTSEKRGTPAGQEEVNERVIDEKSKAHGGDLGKTVFITNLPFEAKAWDVRKQFQQFGEVLSMHLVRHPLTKRLKGTAFLEFTTREAAEAAIAAAASGGVSNDESLANGIIYGGRRLGVLMALDKKSAESLKNEKTEDDKVDRRNLYLAKEGKIEAGTAAAVGVSEKDLEKRRQLEHEKATKLRSPNFHVSRTRLAVYNVPKSMSERELRNLLINAVKSRATKQNPVIRQVKILKDEKKSGKPRGVAFVEFLEHQHALVALRVLNNNPETFRADMRPIVGFAIENLQTLRKREQWQSEGSTGLHERSNLNGTEQGRLKKMKSSIKMGYQPEEEHNSEVGDKGHRKGNGAKKSKDKRTKLHEKSPSEVKSSQESVPSNAKKRKRKSKESFDGSSYEKKLSEDRNMVIPSFSAKNKIHQKPWRGVKEASERTFQPSKEKGESKKIFNQKNGVSGHSASKHKFLESSKQVTKRKSQAEIVDKLDKLVAVYRNKIFSPGAMGKNNKQQANSNASSDLKRWFE